MPIGSVVPREVTFARIMDEEAYWGRVSDASLEYELCSKYDDFLPEDVDPLDEIRADPSLWDDDDMEEYLHTLDTEMLAQLLDDCVSKVVNDATDDAEDLEELERDLAVDAIPPSPVAPLPSPPQSPSSPYDDTQGSQWSTERNTAPERNLADLEADLGLRYQQQTQQAVEPPCMPLTWHCVRPRAEIKPMPNSLIEESSSQESVVLPVWNAYGQGLKRAQPYLQAPARPQMPRTM